MPRWPLLIAAAIPALASAQQPAPPPAAPAAQQPPADDPNVSDEPEVVVRGARTLPGSVVGDIPPEEQLGPADIRSYGVSSVADLLNELGPQTRSGRGSGGPPVVLLNGRRISGFQEIRDVPTEAIARVDILPEEVALKYGYRADQRVVNFVLRQRFRAVTAEAADRITTRGDRNAPQADLDLLNIRRDRRVNLHSEYGQSSPLLESQRNIALAPGAIDQSSYRTLLGRARTFSTNATYARAIGKASATVNGRVEATTGDSLQGLPTVALSLPANSPFGAAATSITRAIGTDPLAQRTATITSHLGATLNGDAGRWRWSLIGAYDRVDSRTTTDGGYDAAAFQARLTAGDPLADPFGSLTLPRLAGARARSTSQDLSLDAQANGTLFALPAGDVSTSIALGGDLIDFSSRSTRLGLTQAGAVGRDSGSARINLDLPLTSRRSGFGDAIGTLSANVNLAVEQLSDFGTLLTIGYGANWAPVDAVRVIASVTDQDGAPTPQQLGNPVVVTPNVRLFDYVTGTTATVTTVSGGNPALAGFNAHTAKLGLTVRPLKTRDLTVIANYVTAHVDNPVAGFPAATAAIAAAFPGRFTRDADGLLTRVDTRPVNFARTERSELRYGFDFSVPLKSKIQKQLELFRAGKGPNPFEGLRPPGRPGGDRAPGAPPAGGEGRPGGGFGGRGGGFGGRGGGGGRLQFALYHTWHFTDRVLVAPGGPRLDLLNGDAIGSAGGSPRHELEGQAGYNNNGLGARLSVNWRSGSVVNGGTPGAPTRLNFGALGTANLRLFADLGQRLDLVRKHPWLRGARVTVGIDNLLDARQRVTDQTGAVPINYQPDLLDPLGRTVRVSLRKLFF